MERFAGRYALVRPLGHGGMGHVWLALDLSTGQECALKRLELKIEASQLDSLRGEFEVLARLRHPLIVGVHELGTSRGGEPFYTMDYVPGLAADAALAGADWAALYEVAARVTEGLEALHAAGIVHGDVKPSNLLVLPGGASGSAPAGVRLVDFGLAALLDRDRVGHRGTAGFAAPEVVQGQPLSVASDLYSLGSTFYVLALTVARPGAPSAPVRPPRDAERAELALKEHGVPPAFSQLIVRLLARTPESRLASAHVVSERIAEIAPASRRSLTDRLDSEQVIGRSAELARLERVLWSTEGGAPLVLLMGEPGIGKSTLQREVMVRAQLARRAVILLACSEGGASGAVARTLLLRLAAAAESVLGTRLSHASLRAQLERGEDALDVEACAEAALAWGTVVRESGQHVLVLLDDFDQLDARSRSIVHRLVAPESPLRWVWASSLTTVLDEYAVWVESGLMEPMRLGRLASEAAADLIAARLRAELPPGLAAGLWSRCAGHPGLTVEALRLAAASGALSESDSGVTLDRAALERLEVAEDFTAACLRRLAELPSDLRLAAAALAVWAEPVPIDRVLRAEPDTRPAALDELVRAGIAVADEQGFYSFQAPALARAVLDQLEATARAALYQRSLQHPGLSPQVCFRLWRGALDAPRALAAADLALREHPDVRLAAEATALARARVPGQAADWAVRTATLLQERGRVREAAPYLEEAIQLAGNDPRAAYWSYLLCGALRRMGENDRVAVQLERALERPLPDRERALLLQCRSGWLVSRGQFEANQEVVAEALRLAEASRDPEAIGMALLSRAAALRWNNRDLEQALADVLRAVRELGRLPLHGPRLRAVATQALLLATMHRHSEAEQVASAGLAEARERQARLAEFELCEALVIIRSELGRWQEARRIAQQMTRIAIEEGLPAGAVQGHAHVDGMSVLMGDSGDFLRHAGQRLASARRHQRYLESSIHRFRATALRDRGALRSAARAFRTAATHAARTGGEYERRWTAIEWGTLLARVGRWRQAAELWGQAWAPRPELDSPTACLLRLDIARAQLRLEQPESAAQAAHEVGAWLEARQGAYAKAHLLLLRAELALVHGDVQAALPLVQELLERFAQLPCPARQAAAAIDCSRLATQHGLDGQLPVHEWLALAAEAFARAGDRRGREQALALAVDWYRRHSPAAVRMRRDRDLLQVVSRLLESMSDFEQLTHEAMRLAVEQLDAERGVLLLVAGDGGLADDDTLHPVVEFGAVDAETRTHALSYSRDVVQRVRRSGGSLVLRDARTEGDRLSQSMVTLGLRSVLCVPLFVASRLVGAVYLDDTRRAETFGDSERALLEGFAELLARAIENSRGQERFRRDYEQLFDENLSLRRDASVRYRPHNIIGGSMALQRVMSVVERAAATSSTVLITGENGTGKELIARMLHHAGPRSLKPFVAVNCGAIPANLLESELFGILSDTATGVKARPGSFVEADGGTLFLDEIGEMPMQQQVALLRVLSVGAVSPLGGNRPRPVDVRVIAATNRDLAKDIVDGRFRQDLWYRLNVIPVELPPLRERRADIPALAQHFAAKFAAQQQREVPEISPALMAVLMQSDWPGNVRELQNYIERLMAMTSGKVLRPDQLPHDLQKRARQLGRIDRGRTLREMVAELERRQLQEALERNAGNQSEAAKELGLTEQSLRYRLRRYALSPVRHFRRTR